MTGRSDTPTLSEVDLGVEVECWKSMVKSVASRGIESPVLNYDTSTLFEKWRRHFAFETKMSSSFDSVFYFFFIESRRHLELFNGIVHELIELYRAKLTEILTRQKTLEQAPVFQLMLPRQYLFKWRLLPVHQLSLSQLWVHHTCGLRHCFSNRVLRIDMVKYMSFTGDRIRSFSGDSEPPSGYQRRVWSDWSGCRNPKFFGRDLRETRGGEGGL